MLTGPHARKSRGILLALGASAFLMVPVAPSANPGIAAERAEGTTATTATTVAAPATATTATAAAAAARVSRGPTSYAATIADAQTGAADLLASSGAASLSVSLVAGNTVVWQEAFGIADRATGTVPTSTTMYGIGSVSKMFAAIAVMQLVDAGLVSLDTPVVTYLPAFRMADPGYAQITVRMLLNHSAGLPGSDYFNTLTTAPNPDYVAHQFLATLATERLKTTPGAMSVYCNDCFTLAELVVAAVSGKTYNQYVTDEIFTPLGMTHSRFPTAAFANSTYGHAYADATTTTADPQEFVNLYGSGAIWSTPADMAHAAAMLLNGGVYAGHQILSAASVAEMGRDQTLTTLGSGGLNPFVYGLGWDSVRQGGLNAVGITGWMKGGDTAAYHAAFLLAPDQQLAVIVEGAGYTLNSGPEEDLAERILLHARGDQGVLAQMPAVLEATTLPTETPTSAQLAAIVGIYGAGGGTFRVTADGAGALSFSPLNGNAWAVNPAAFTLRSDGAFWATDAKGTSFRVVTAWGRQYLDLRQRAGYGHYRTDILLGERVLPGKPLAAAWQARLGKTWLVVTDVATSTNWGMPPTVSIAAIPNLPGYVGLDGNGGGNALTVVDPSTSTTLGAMFLVIPTAQGRDLADVTFFRRGSEEWLRTGSAVARPIASVPALSSGVSTVRIGKEGYAEWRSIAVSSTLVIRGRGAWKLYDASLAVIAAGTGNARSVAAPAGSYLEVFGRSWATTTVKVIRAH